MSGVQTWTVVEWGVIDGDLLGCRILCVACEGRADSWCEMCDGDGELFQPYRLPNGAPLDLYRDAELLIQIEPSEATPS